MAAPAVHLIRGLAWHASHGAPFDQAAFARGSVFPDIRYLGVVRREQTHDRPYAGKEVLAAPHAFEAGRRHHNLLDAAWNRYYHALDWGVPPSGYYAFGVALKSVEATMVLAKTPNCDEIAAMLDGLDVQPVSEWGLATDDVRRWQDMVQADVRASASLDDQLRFLDDLRFEAELAATVRRHAAEILRSPVWRERMAGFVDASD